MTFFKGSSLYLEYNNTPKYIIETLIMFFPKKAKPPIVIIPANIEPVILRLSFLIIM